VGIKSINQIKGRHWIQNAKVTHSILTTSFLMYSCAVLLSGIVNKPDCFPACVAANNCSRYSLKRILISMLVEAP